MRVAILSAGPSLSRTFDPGAHHDLRIGVNAAAGAFACDWWVCGDGETMRRVTPIGKPAIFTMKTDNSQMRQVLKGYSGHRVEEWGPWKRRMDAPALWTNWSITAALVLAVDLGASSVEVFGHDMQGATDLSGHTLAKREKNWGRVAGDWKAVCAWAERVGVQVVERRPETAECV